MKRGAFLAAVGIMVGINILMGSMFREPAVLGVICVIAILVLHAFALGRFSNYGGKA
jgi:hypothetical protein